MEPNNNQNIDLTETQQSGSSLSHAYNLIASGRSFVQFDMGISQLERDLLADLKVDRSGAWDAIDTVNNLDRVITQALKDLGNADSESTAVFLRHTLALAELTVRDARADGAWLNIRSSNATEARPLRWHTDSFYFTPAAGQEYLTKTVFVAKGQCSLFCEITDPERREQFYKLQKELGTTDYADTITHKRLQTELNKLVLPEEIVQPLAPYKAALFAAGFQHTSAFHSEPDFTEDRIYTQIVPASFFQMHELRTRFASR